MRFHATAVKHAEPNLPHPGIAAGNVLPYERRLANDARWALREGRKLFEGKKRRSGGAHQDHEAPPRGGGTSDDHAYLVTTDPEVARKYGTEEEDEGWEGDDSEHSATSGHGAT